MKRVKKFSLNKEIFKKRMIQLAVLLVVVILVVFLTIFVVKKLRGDDTSVGDGKVVSNNRVSKPGDVVEHDATDGMHINRISKLLAGGSDCYAIEEFANDNKVLASDISITRAYYAALEDSFYNSSKNEISLNEFREAVQKIFGKDYKFDPSDGELDKVCGSYKYNESTKKFVKQNNKCKLSCGVSTTTYNLVKVVEEYGKYTIDVNVLFGSRSGDVAFYSDYARENLVTNSYSEAASGNVKGSTYRFVFGSSGSVYTFVSSEKVS